MRMEASANTYEECNANSRVTLRDTWPPAWLVPKEKPTAEPAIEPAAEPDVPKPEAEEEPNSLAWEAALVSEEADARLAAALSEFEPCRIEPPLTSGQAHQRLAAMVAEADDWIERIGADGCRGWDRPGQPVHTRWWEYTSIDELPDWRDILLSGSSTREGLPSSPRGATTETNASDSSRSTNVTQRSLDF